MSTLQGQIGELSFTVQITRAATGTVETYELVGKVTAEQAEELGITIEEDDGSHPLDSSPQRSD